MKIQVLMSTCGDRKISDINLLEKNISGPFVICSQFVKEEGIDQNDQGILFSVNEKGLAKSRNKLISEADGDIGIITDDDIVFDPKYQEIIKETYLKYPNIDFITFNTKMGNRIIGNKKIKKMNLFQCMATPSFQITVRIKKIKENKILFDERFGLGSIYAAGEENIFLNDCKKAGLKGLHIPIVINEHPDEQTTGEKWTKALIESKGALSYRVLGVYHIIFLLYFVITKYTTYKNDFSIRNFIKYYYIGLNSIR